MPSSPLGHRRTWIWGLNHAPSWHCRLCSEWSRVIRIARASVSSIPRSNQSISEGCGGLCLWKHSQKNTSGDVFSEYKLTLSSLFSPPGTVRSLTGSIVCRMKCQVTY